MSEQALFSQILDDRQEVRQDLLEEVPCNLCGSEARLPWAAKDGWTVVQCTACGLVYVNPRLNARGMALVYADDYFTIQYDPEDSRKRLAMYAIEIEDLERTIRGGRLLDVGAGRGDFLSVLGPHWEKHGCEINPLAVAYAKERHGLALVQGGLRDGRYPDAWFDCVNLRGVIEHLPDPLSELREARRVLKPGGVLALNTPNIDSLCARLYREGFRLMDPRFHIYYFSVRTLSRLLERAELRVLREAFFYLDTPYADPVKDVQKLAEDLALMRQDPSVRPQSPPFFDNVMNLYAVRD